MEKCRISTRDFVEYIRAIAKIVTSHRPNLAELKQTEKVLKSRIVQMNSDELLSLIGRDPVQLVLVLQYIAKGLSTGRIEVDTKSLFLAMQSILNDSECTNVVRRHLIQVMAIAIVGRIDPDSLTEFMTNAKGISDIDKLAILLDIPSLEVSTQKESIARWSSEVFALAVGLGNLPLLEKWVSVTAAEVVKTSNLIPSIDLGSVSAFSDVIRECCKKKELIGHVVPLIQSLLETRHAGHLMHASLFIGHLAVASRESLDLLIHTKSILELPLPLPQRIEFVENCFGLLEKSNEISSLLFEWIVVATVFPFDAQSFPVRIQEDTDHCYFRRFSELRQDARQILRSATFSDQFESELTDVLRSIISGCSNWRIAESILHACSSFGRKLPSLTRPILDILGSVNPDNTRRGLLNSLMVCLTTFLQHIPEPYICSILKFALSCLSSIPTNEDSGWFPFRSKQDNSCVVLLQAIVKERKKVDVAVFLSDLRNCMAGIKLIFYAKDSFRQTRSIFIRSVVAIAKTHDEVEPALKSLIVLLCDDCQDIADFVQESKTFNETLFPIIAPLLDSFLRDKAEGVETVIATCCHFIRTDEIKAAIQLTGPDRWLRVVPEIALRHGPDFVLFFAPYVSPPKISAEWIRSGLLTVPLQPMNRQFHYNQLHRILLSATVCDKYEQVSEYFLNYVKEAGAVSLPLMREFILLTVRRATRCCGSESLSYLGELDKILGAQLMESNLQECFPSLPSECGSLISAIREGNNGKSRRIMKKLALALT